MKGTERHRLIIDRLRAEGHVDVADLVATTGASDMTVRRDLDRLAAQGLLRRVHGGAVPTALHTVEPPFQSRLADAHEVKQRLARTVAGLLADGESVALDSGTTCLEIARRLRDRAVTVMPVSLHAITALADAPAARLLVPGGEPRTGELSLIGPLTVRSLQALRFDTAVISPCAFSIREGATAYDLADAEIKQTMLGVSARTILVADSTKWGRTAFAHICGPERVDILVTDDQVPAEQRDRIADQGTQVVVC